MRRYAHGQSVMSASTIGAIDNNLLLLLAVLCLVMLSVSMLRRTQQRQATAREVTREQLARLRDQRDVQQSMEELVLQLEDVSRRVNAQVDTKFVKLETVIRDADQRIARLEQLSRGAPGDDSDPPAPALPQDEPPAIPSNAAHPERLQRIYELADSGATPMTIADTLEIPLGQVELILNLRKFK